MLHVHAVLERSSQAERVYLLYVYLPVSEYRDVVETPPTAEHHC